MKYCVKCGEIMPDTAKYCGICGVTQPVEAKAEERVQKTPVQVQNNGVKVCPFCAETIKAEATVCRFCQRNLTASGGMFTRQNVNTRAMAFAIGSLIIEAIVIIIMFTDLLMVELDMWMLGSYELGISVFSCFDAAELLSALGIHSSDIEEMSMLLKLVGVIYVIVIGLCVIYYVYNFTRYSFTGDNLGKAQIVNTYSKFSILAPLSFVILLLVTWMFVYALLSDTNIVGVSLSKTSITMIVLIGVQLLLNSIY